MKNTILWVILVEIPLFVKAIEKAKDSRFFRKLINDNLALITIIQFIFGFWSFGLLTELILIPSALFLGLMYAITSKEEKYKAIKKILDMLLLTFTCIALFFIIRKIVRNPYDLFNSKALKEFLLPLLLLFLNLPIVYGLALFNMYEQIFIRLKGSSIEKRKMKKRILLFGNFNLTKTSSIINKGIHLLITSLTDKDMEKNIKILDKYLESRVGDNYMKRANFYKLCCILGFIISVFGLIICNSDVSIKDIITLNFAFNFAKAKEIITYICSIGITLCLCLFVYSIGYSKKKYEEISQIKKYALQGYLYLLNRQFRHLKEVLPIDEPQELFIQYIEPAIELKIECEKIISSYDNLLSYWELDSIKQLQLYADIFLKDICHDENTLINMGSTEYISYHNKRIKDAPQNEKINTFKYTIKKDAEKYAEQVNLCRDEFKNLIDK
ncbi:hypothetical protein [Ruminiclostridium papyrosolvens]|uniref:hypothetical protein n=1 Tax=Ruminiclostridium papyrosolvens TaxID=29362 RepID=UPI001039460A|nr:hypothetical protein [Ruminiclostridium papyrosolvens]